MKTSYKGNTIGIRPFRQTDIVPFYEAARESTVHIYRFLPWCHADYSLAESTDWVETRLKAWNSDEAYSFAIDDLNSNQFLGSIEINQIYRNFQFANIGYWIRKQSLNRGVATEAIKLVQNFGFQELGLNRLEIVVDIDNPASRRVAEKAGAIFEGVLRKRLMYKGKCIDAAMYCLTENP